MGGKPKRESWVTKTLEVWAKKQKGFEMKQPEMREHQVKNGHQVRNVCQEGGNSTWCQNVKSSSKMISEE